MEEGSVSGKRSTAWLERVLVAVAIFCVGWLVGVYGYGWYFRAERVSAFNELVGDLRDKKPALPDVGPPAPAPTAAAPEDRDLVGIIEVPRLGISSPVISGDDERALDVAVGHLADTPMPWEHGNSAVAAHRDTLFRPLEHVKAGDVVRMRTTRGDFEYRVKSTKIVEPDDVSVLSAAGADALTLITCYPFRFVGHAPQRFIVRAERVGSLPETTGIRRTSLRSGSTSARPSASPVQRAVSTNGAQDSAVKAAAENAASPHASNVVKSKGPAHSSARTQAGSPQQKKMSAKSRASASVKAETPDDQRKKKASDEPRKKRRWYHIFIGER